MATDRYSLPGLWVRRFAIVERLDPFTPMEGRDIPLRRGLNVVWGNGESREAEELLTRHGDGKTLVCLVRLQIRRRWIRSSDPLNSLWELR